MRPVSWFAGLLIAVAVATSVGAVVLARERADSSHRLTASRHTVPAGTLTSPDDQVSYPPHRMQLPTPAPTPEATPAPAAPAAAPAAPAPPAPARPAIVVNSTQQALINQDRAAHGLPPLTWNGCLYNVAVSNANRIASQGYLSHTNGPSVDLGCGLGNQAGENIGYWSLGVNDPKLNSMFMASPDHYANIMGPYRFVATAWVVASNGYGYIAVEFG